MKFAVALEQELVDVLKEAGRFCLENKNGDNIGFGYVKDNKVYYELFDYYDPRCPICVSKLLFSNKKWCWICKECGTILDYNDCIFKTNLGFIDKRPRIFGDELR